MSKQITLIQATKFVTVAALLLAVGAAAQAAPQEVVKLPRVVVIGKAVTVATLPRVVVVGKATPDVQVAKIEVLPRVVVLGRAQQQQPEQLLASTTTAAPIAVKFIARAL